MSKDDTELEIDVIIRGLAVAIMICIFCLITIFVEKTDIVEGNLYTYTEVEITPDFSLNLNRDIPWSIYESSDTIVVHDQDTKEDSNVAICWLDSKKVLDTIEKHYEKEKALGYENLTEIISGEEYKSFSYSKDSYEFEMREYPDGNIIRIEYKDTVKLEEYILR